MKTRTQLRHIAQYNPPQFNAIIQSDTNARQMVIQLGLIKADPLSQIGDFFAQVGNFILDSTVKAANYLKENPDVRNTLMDLGFAGLGYSLTNDKNHQGINTALKFLLFSKLARQGIGMINPELKQQYRMYAANSIDKALVPDPDQANTFGLLVSGGAVGVSELCQTIKEPDLMHDEYLQKFFKEYYPFAKQDPRFTQLRKYYSNYITITKPQLKKLIRINEIPARDKTYWNDRIDNFIAGLINPQNGKFVCWLEEGNWDARLKKGAGWQKIINKKREDILKVGRVNSDSEILDLIFTVFVAGQYLESLDPDSNEPRPSYWLDRRPDDKRANKSVLVLGLDVNDNFITTFTPKKIKSIKRHLEEE